MRSDTTNSVKSPLHEVTTALDGGPTGEDDETWFFLQNHISSTGDWIFKIGDRNVRLSGHAAKRRLIEMLQVKLEGWVLHRDDDEKL